MRFEKEPDELVLLDGVKQIRLSMDHKKYIGWHEDEFNNIIDEYDDDQIEICYREDDEDGTGVGGGEFISTSDIQAMANCIRDVVSMNKAKANYHCQDDVIRLSIQYDARSNTFTFSVGLIETLLREYHITITKRGLSRNALEEYIQPFFIWENEYPIVCNKQ